MTDQLGTFLVLVGGVALGYAILAGILELIDARHRWRWPR